MENRGPAVARELWRLVEPIHAVTYFSPEPLAALKEAGYRGFWMGYFAGRAAPLGAASAELVHAIFHNFRFEHVAKAIPDAWGFAPPETALAARQEGSVATLRRHLGDRADSSDVQRAAELTARATGHAPLEGRPLFAANRALPQPADPVPLLWHSATLLREHRGDGHLAALTAAGIGGREAHVLQALSAGTAPEVYRTTRNFDEDEWTSILTVLQERGLVDADGKLSEHGRVTKRAIEDSTDELAWTAYEALDDADLDELLRLLRPITAAIVAAGEMPTPSPMGLDLPEWDAPSA